MKTTFPNTLSRSRNMIKGRHILRSYMITALVVFGIYFGLNEVMCRAQSDADNGEGAEVLTRGPVHEAFAETVSYNPEPGMVAPKAPPAVIEELPPDEKPDGDNVTWIPGYWAWDDERNDFLWVSGVWRALPPGREWVAGYWAASGTSFQWTSGYWADSTVAETEYLPAPPRTVEAGPNIAAPSPDYGWVPGTWVWHQSRYAWRPGYWDQCRADWEWIPAHYIWTRRGYIFVDGYWDYSVDRRGVLFAPVYFDPRVYSRVGYYYSPTIVIGLGGFEANLFVRPRYSHYYFGDYYAVSYQDEGFFASFSFVSSPYGYDPIFAHQRWRHRRDRNWEQNLVITFNSRRDNVNERPPRTWEAQKRLGRDTSKNKSLMIGEPLAELAKSKDSSMQFQPVDTAERKKLSRRGKEVAKSSEERQTQEVSASVDASDKTFKPSKVKVSKSTIVAKSTDQLGKDQAPPERHKASKMDSTVETQTAAGGGTDSSAGEVKAKKQKKQEKQELTSEESTSDSNVRKKKSQPETETSKPVTIPVETNQGSGSNARNKSATTDGESESTTGEVNTKKRIKQEKQVSQPGESTPDSNVRKQKSPPEAYTPKPESQVKPDAKNQGEKKKKKDKDSEKTGEE